MMIRLSYDPATFMCCETLLPGSDQAVSTCYFKTIASLAAFVLLHQISTVEFVSAGHKLDPYYKEFLLDVGISVVFQQSISTVGAKLRVKLPKPFYLREA